jgi:hypothetical protein
VSRITPAGAAGDLNHFFSTLESLERSLGSAPLNLDPGDEECLGRDFSRLLAPVIGAADTLFYRVMERIRGKKPEALRTLGALAAFFLEEDEPSPALQEDDWREIQTALEDASGEMDLETLTRLMGKLLSGGKLKPARQ